MRIIRGKYGKRRFDVPKNITARPTTDFARENTLRACLFQRSVEVELQPVIQEPARAQQSGVGAAECHLFCDHIGTVCNVLHFCVLLDSKALCRIDHSDRVKSQAVVCLLVLIVALFEITPADAAVGVAAVVLQEHRGILVEFLERGDQLANGHGVLDLAGGIAGALCVDEKLHVCVLLLIQKRSASSSRASTRSLRSSQSRSTSSILEYRSALSWVAYPRKNSQACPRSMCSCTSAGKISDWSRRKVRMK